VASNVNKVFTPTIVFTLFFMEVIQLLLTETNTTNINIGYKMMDANNFLICTPVRLFGYNNINGM
jgi:hypothetical protein